MCPGLEDSLRHPVMDDTGLEGVFDIKLQASMTTQTI
jgi:uncharacterized protein (TIGR03435 family)